MDFVDSQARERAAVTVTVWENETHRRMKTREAKKYHYLQQRDEYVEKKERGEEREKRGRKREKEDWKRENITKRY